LKHGAQHTNGPVTLLPAPIFALRATEPKPNEDGLTMNGMRMLAIALIVGGGLALLYGGFSYTTETQQAKLGPLVLKVVEKETVNIPIWLGVGALATGLVLLFMRK
jgi:hypothetical protein